MDAYIQRSIERKADIQASAIPASGSTLFLGSSIIEEGPWSELFETHKAVNWGVSAETTDDLLKRLDNVVAAKPAKIVLYTGGNDLSRLGRTSSEALENVNAIVIQLQTALPQTDLYLNTLFPREATHAEVIIRFNTGLKTIAIEQSVTLIDGYSLLLGENGAIDPAYSNDGIHLSGAAYHLWARHITEAFNQ